MNPMMINKAQNLVLAKTAAERASHAKTELLDNMRHDIRTPLSGIIGSANLIHKKVTIRRLKTMRASCRRLLSRC
jgi:signal transduction histidine kinase